MPEIEMNDEPAMMELDEASIAAVAGGLNPQPLPPGHTEHRLD